MVVACYWYPRQRIQAVYVEHCQSLLPVMSRNPAHHRRASTISSGLKRAQLKEVWTYIYQKNQCIDVIDDPHSNSVREA